MQMGPIYDTPIHEIASKVNSDLSRPHIARSRSPDGLSQSGSAKKPRAATACEGCRSRKLACAGGLPCARCRQDNKDCYYADKPNRSPLTRARMTELEETIALCGRLWDSIFPGFSLNTACQRYSELGIDAVRTLAFECLPTGPRQIKEHLSQTLYSTPPTFDGRNSPVESPSHESFPRRLIESERDPSTYEWHENRQVMSERRLDGMASLAIAEEGVSYLGLSSGATFLNAIKRLTPKHTLSVSPDNSISSDCDTGKRKTYDAAGQSMYPSRPISSGISVTRGINPLPSLTEILPLVDSYFKYFHTFTPLVHEPTIRAQIMGALPISNKPGSEVLLYMIFAMGAYDLANNDDREAGNLYYEVARSALQRDMLEEGSMPLVQGLAVMANYLQRSNRPNAGYLTLGLAIRMAVGLGLHTPLTGWRCSPLEREMRSRVWWSVVTLEAGCSVTFGRPHGVGLVQLTSVPLPINCNDEHLTVSSLSIPPESPDITLYSALVTQSKFARVMCSIHDHILQSHPAPTLEQIRRYDSRIVEAMSTIPPHSQSCSSGPYRLARSAQVWRIRDFRAILYRPILLMAAWDARNRKELSSATRDAISICRTLALENLHEIGEFVRTEQDSARGAEWYTLYFAFQSSLTILLSVVWEPGHPSVAMWRNVINSTASWFRRLQSMRAFGSSYAQILENIVESVSSPPANSSEAVTSVLRDSPINRAPVADGIADPQAALDVERYWLEIMGNELALPTLYASSWDQFIIYPSAFI